MRVFTVGIRGTRFISSSHLINCAQYRAGIDRHAILHQDLRQNAGGRRSDLVRHVISIDLDQGLANADWIANDLEPSPDRQPQDAGNLWHFYFCPHYSLISSPFSPISAAPLEANFRG